MPITPKFNENEWEQLIALINEGAAKSYICRAFNITKAQLKKLLKQLKM